MRILFIQLELPWPIHSGQHLHSFYMMRELSREGNLVRLVCPTGGESLPTLEERQWEFEKLEPQHGQVPTRSLSWFQRKWLSYWGVPDWIPWVLYRKVEEFCPDVVVGVGLQILPIFGLVKNVPVIWYAGDDWVLHYLSLLKSPRIYSRIECLLCAFRSFLYERSLVPKMSGVVVVSKRDQRWMRWIAGVKKVEVISPGIDLEKFAPSTAQPKPYSLVFWGRLDYVPNIDAILWFEAKVFSRLRKLFPKAELTIVGAHPVARVQELRRKPGIRLAGEVDDIRPFVWSSACVVIPIRVGYGIRIKLLEASALGAATIVSPRCLNGLSLRKAERPWLLARSPDEWIEKIKFLWSDEKQRALWGQKARRWGEREHNWATSAHHFQQFLRQVCTD